MKSKIDWDDKDDLAYKMYNQGRKDEREKILNKIKEVNQKTYHSCDCGDYNEGCTDCMKKDIVNKIKEGEKE